MSDPFNLINFLNSHSNESHEITGISSDSFLFIYDHFKNDSDDNEILIFDSSDQAYLAFEKSNNEDHIYFPGLGSNPYSSITPSENLLNQRFLALNTLVKSKSPKRVYTSFEALHLKLPPKSYFSKDNFKVSVSDIIAPDDLKLKLIELGFQYTPSIEEEGTFTNKGEIFDIFPYDHTPIRIHYFDDMIEEIFAIDEETLKTKREMSFNEISILGSALEIINSKSVLNLRNNLYRPDRRFKEKTTYRNEIFHKLNNGYFFDRYPIYISSFFTESSTLLDYLPNSKIISFNHLENINSFSTYLEQLKEDFDIEVEDEHNPYVSPSLDSIYCSNQKLEKLSIISNFDSNSNIQSKLNFSEKSVQSFVRENYTEHIKDKIEFNRILFKVIKDRLSGSGNLLLAYKTENSKIELDYLMDLHELNQTLGSRIQYINLNIDSGFYNSDSNIVVLSEADIFSRKIVKSVSKKRSSSSDVFADQISTLKIGDYVIHKNFGVGKYLGIENLSNDTTENDFLAIEYDNQDKVYVPLYKMDLVQKHAEATNTVKIANLNSKKFEHTKTKAKSSVKKLAFDLLKLQAKRNSQTGFAFSAPDKIFTDFEQAFPYQETPDQLHAIEDVLSDMQSSKPMDRLVCGDVGFGKTEVAMRASFKAVLDNKQVAVLVPTTVLAYQHYNTFIKRFKNFPVNIEFISRFKTAKEVTKILSDIDDGKIDILIGTHKLLSDKIKYKDLGLVVVDEEQRFGVTHKEKLKVLKSSVDSLILTATPIPRTLQLSFLGIKDLSIIKSAPPRRQSIKSYVIKEDPNTIRSAIRKELSRGGQLFIVHNRVHDIENYAAYIQKLTPEAKIIIAHGQLAEKELEKRIKSFYEQKFDILISTTIIESGIDIPSANTLIIDRADRYGLSQLHQLRGRIGRSDKKAYAYFITPHDRDLSDIAKKRLKALQTYADLGSGFSLATNDLEIRGSGDILGAEQSGHIEEIGLELYMELLKDAIHELKGEKPEINNDIEILTPFDASLPKSYIHDAGSRLKFYKRLSNTKTLETLDNIIDEISDLYGKIPKSVENLSIILKVKIILGNLPIKSIKVGTQKVTIKFDESSLENKPEIRDQIVQLFMSRPKIYKLSPNFSVQCSFKEKVDLKTFFEFAEYIALQIDA